jgi:hypothetical protein
MSLSVSSLEAASKYCTLPRSGDFALTSGSRRRPVSTAGRLPSFSKLSGSTAEMYDILLMFVCIVDTFTVDDSAAGWQAPTFFSSSLAVWYFMVKTRVGVCIYSRNYKCSCMHQVVMKKHMLEGHSG